MNKTKKPPCKKVLIRNTIQEKPRTVIVNEYAKKADDAVEKKSEEKGQKAHEPFSMTESKKFESPELNSALRIARKINSVENVKPRKVKSISDLDKKKSLAHDDKVSRQVNFPYETHLYKDLIPLCVKTHPQQVISREPLPLKDKEPSLEDFFIPKKSSEHTYQVPLQNVSHNINLHHDGLKLHRIMQNWI